MFPDATLQYSSDGETWTDAGTYTDSPLIVAEFDEPVTARHVRLLADSTGGKWVKIREFQVLPDSEQFASTVPSVDGAGVSGAFDGDVATAFRAAAAPEGGAAITYRFPEPTTVGSVSVLGTGVGIIEVEVDGAWTVIGELTAGRGFHESELEPAADATAVRLSFEPGSAAPVIYEVVGREGGPIGVEPTEPPTQDPTEEPPTIEPTGDETAEPTGATGAPTGGTDTPGGAPRGPDSQMPDTGLAVGPLTATAAALLAAGGAALALTLRRRRAS